MRLRPSRLAVDEPIHALERRRLFAAAPFANVDIAPLAGNQSEVAIAADPVHPQRLFAAANDDEADEGLLVATSGDGGATWSHRVIGDGKDGLPPACCDPTVAFDAFGNLFLAYLNAVADNVELLRSTDGGATFTLVRSFGRDLDQPTVSTGGGSVWLTFTKGDRVGAVGAAVTGLGQVGEFQPQVSLSGSGGGAFGDVAIGPDGQVAVTYQKDTSGRSPIGVNVDPDGLGPAGFGKRVTASKTRVRQFVNIPAQPERGIDAESALAYDTSPGANRGRLYLAYTDASGRPRYNTDIFLRYSDDNGATWSRPVRVNDDTGTNSQFFPKLQVSATDGTVLLSWYDARDDAGTAADPNNPDAPQDLPNDEVAIYAARLIPAPQGLLLSANVRVSPGVTSAGRAGNGIDLGDYIGLTLGADDVAHPAWADNSNSNGTNPDGSTGPLDICTAAFPLSAMPAPDRLQLVLPAPNDPAIAPVDQGVPLVVRKAGAFRFSVTVAGATSPLDPTLIASAIEITTPFGADFPPLLIKSKTSRSGVLKLTFQIEGPASQWTASENGTYLINLRDGVVLDLLGNPLPGGTIGWLVVAR